MRNKLAIIAVLAMGIAAGAANAQTVSVTGKGNPFYWEKFDYQLNGVQNWAWADGLNTTLNGVSCMAFSVDLNHPYFGSSNVNVAPSGTFTWGVNSAVAPSNLGGAAWLLNTYGMSATTQDQIMGLQIAIFEAEYDTGIPDLTKGKFVLTGVGGNSNTAAVTAQANWYLSQYGGNKTSVATLYTALSHGSGNVNPDLLACPPGTSVPEPGAMGLFGSGLVGCATMFLRRRRKA